MTVNAARLLRDGDTVFVALACPINGLQPGAPHPRPKPGDDLRGGCNRARPARLPLSIGDPTLVLAPTRSAHVNIFSLNLQRAMGGGIPWRRADRPYGNINATGSRLHHPKTRRPLRGSMEIAAWANRCYIITPHQKRRFPEKGTSAPRPFFLGGRAEREASGFAAAALNRVDQPWHPRADETGELVLTALHRAHCGPTRENTGWIYAATARFASPNRPSAKNCAYARRTRSAGDLFEVKSKSTPPDLPASGEYFYICELISTDENQNIWLENHRKAHKVPIKNTLWACYDL